MIVAITGGTGFIGRKLVERHLECGDEVRVLTRRDSQRGPYEDVKLFRGDLASPDVQLLYFVSDANVLYHCAGELRDPQKMTALHVDGTQRLIEAARSRIGRWVQLSSVGAYGPRRDACIVETTPPAPVGIYERTKTLADDHVQAAALHGAFESVIVRPAIVFGPDMPNRSLFDLITMIKRRWFFFLGRPGASANYIFVDNVVEAMHIAGMYSRATGQIYNITDWRCVETFVGKIAQCLGVPCPWLRLPEQPLRIAARWLQYIPRMPLTESRVNALCTRARYPIDKIVAELNYRHVVSMEDGLQRMVARWREREARPTRSPRLAWEGNLP